MEWKKYIGKKIFVKLKDGSCYTGTIDYADTNSVLDDDLITMIDKFDKYVTFWASEIYKLKEEDDTKT